GRTASRLVARCLRPRLVDQQLDLVDLALDLERLGGEARGEVRDGGGFGRRVGRRIGRGCRLCAGLRGDLSPPAS
ncbi:MAG TPA: hypothetical protein VFI15_07830, partial [Candidatus Limnocylindrales bacterium]|nr:hypothetical protein [Candidatus Limnocylindrales bacterium]